MNRISNQGSNEEVSRIQQNNLISEISILRRQRAQSLVGFSVTREPWDNYPTPTLAVDALIKQEIFEGSVWEPACGAGNIAHYFPNCMASDMRTDASIYGEKGVNFLTEYREVDHIVTNPPYRFAQAFVEHAIGCARSKVAMLCKLAFLEGKSRYYLFQKHPIKTVYVFSRRLTLTKEGDCRKQSGMIPFAWFVWEKGYRGTTGIKWLLIGDETSLCYRQN